MLYSLRVTYQDIVYISKLLRYSRINRGKSRKAGNWIRHKQHANPNNMLVTLVT
jgi:hypothetical protein